MSCPVALTLERVGEWRSTLILRGTDLTGEEVIEFLAGQVAPYKKVRRVEFIDAIPKSTSGKILRKDLRSPTA